MRVSVRAIIATFVLVLPAAAGLRATQQPQGAPQPAATPTPGQTAAQRYKNVQDPERRSRRAAPARDAIHHGVPRRRVRLLSRHGPWRRVRQGRQGAQAARPRNDEDDDGHQQRAVRRPSDSRLHVVPQRPDAAEPHAGPRSRDDGRGSGSVPGGSWRTRRPRRPGRWSRRTGGTGWTTPGRSGRRGGAAHAGSASSGRSATRRRTGLRRCARSRGGSGTRRTRRTASDRDAGPGHLEVSGGAGRQGCTREGDDAGADGDGDDARSADVERDGEGDRQRPLPDRHRIAARRDGPRRRRQDRMVAGWIQQHGPRSRGAGVPAGGAGRGLRPAAASCRSLRIAGRELVTGMSMESRRSR